MPVLFHLECVGFDGEDLPPMGIQLAWIHEFIRMHACMSVATLDLRINLNSVDQSIDISPLCS